jgi:phosphoribosylformylglycinamidine cyclo-ligase
VDYLAVSRLDEDMIEEIMDGLASGAKEAEVPIVGGETAVIPDMLADRLSDVKAKKGRGGRGRVMQDGLPIDNVFDLSGTVIGIAKKDELILGESIAIGDVIVGIESNGLHANGYTLVRHVLLSKYTLEDTPEGLSSKLKDELLRPTRIYVKPTLELIEHADVHGIAHVTGGAYRKLTRLKDDVRFTIEHDVEQEIFNVIKRHARIDDREMYSTFNMGIGLCVIVAKGDEDYTISTYNRYGMNAKVIGRIDEGRGVYINGIRITT